MTRQVSIHRGEIHLAGDHEMYDEPRYVHQATQRMPGLLADHPAK